jgi:carbon monoxide dehydrogenase subunit G
MENIESKQGKIAASAETVYNFLSDLRNLDSLIPEDKVQDWTSTEDSCSFSVPQAGNIQLKLTKKEPFKLIRVEPEGSGPMGIGFSLYIQMMEVGEMDTRIKLTFRAQMNSMIKMMVAGPLKKGLDQIVDTVENIRINPANQ